MKWKIEYTGEEEEERFLKLLVDCKSIFSSICNAQEAILKRLKYSPEEMTEAEEKFLRMLQDILYIELE